MTMSKKKGQVLGGERGRIAAGNLYPHAEKALQVARMSHLPQYHRSTRSQGRACSSHGEEGPLCPNTGGMEKVLIMKQEVMSTSVSTESHSS